MAISTQTVWEVRFGSGSATNGGGFVAGAAGTDYSQQNSAQYTASDLAVDGTTNTKVTSVSHSFVSADVGNILCVSAGVGWTTGWYQIVSAAAGAATLDRSPAAVSTTGGTYAVGGALDSLSTLAGAMVASNKAFLTGSTTITATPTGFAQAVIPNAGSLPSRLIGYGSTRGDGGRASITISTTTGVKAINITQYGWSVENFNIDCGSLSGTYGIYFGSTYGEARNCKVANFGAYGIYLANSNSCVHDCEVAGGASGATAAINLFGTGITAQRNYLHANACPGILVSAGQCTVVRNLIVGTTGSTSDGISLNAASGCAIFWNTISGTSTGRHGIYASSAQFAMLCQNNILANHTNTGAAGLKCSSAGWSASPDYDGNAYYNNTNSRVNEDDTTVNPINAVSPYTNVLDIPSTSITVSPFTNASGGDYTLNNTSGGGAAIRAKGTPGAMPAVSQVGYPDMGVYQHQDSGGGGSIFVFSSEGGL